MKEGERTWDHWCSPEWLLDLVRQVGPIALDPASNEHSRVAAAEEWRGGCSLDKSWCREDGLTWLNPPYSRGQIGAWVQKAIREAALGCEIVALLPARTGSAWGQRALVSADAICFLSKRVRFDNPPPGETNTSPRFDSMVAYWGPSAGDRFGRAFKGQGVCVFKESAAWAKVA